MSIFGPLPDRPKPPLARPQTDAAWCTAKSTSPTRTSYTDAELIDLRIRYTPQNLGAGVPGHAVEDVVAIWTLLNMLEEQRGWKV